VERAEQPFRNRAGDLEALREALYDCMWADVGILRSADSLRRALRRLAELDTQLAHTGVAATDRAFHMGWHDWLNLKNLVEVSRVIAMSAQAREDSRGAHYREDFPDTDALDGSRYIVVRRQGDALDLAREPVRFTRVAPGQSLLAHA
jgi:fumarate reductase flavoprotein subunit